MARSRDLGRGIAIVGMDCWYPGAESLVEFWENILAKRQQFRRMPDQRLPLQTYHSPDKSVPDKTYGTEAAVIDGFLFDWKDRRIPKKVVDATDIVHWLALEVAVKALENARLDLATLQRLRTGVILGNTLTGEWTRTNAMRMRWPYVERVLRETAAARGLVGEAMDQYIASVGTAYKSVFPEVTEDTLAGALSNTIAGRVCNFFDLHGGGYTVDGACSSSLIAVITAARNLASGDLDVAFAGGIDISLDTFELIGFAKTGALTPDEMRVYDRRANGFIPGEGCGFVILKRLEDAELDGDRVLAVIQGWGISSDGKGGLTAPSVDGQAMAIREAYRLAGYGLHEVQFIEGHGTGTTVGDKVEITALVQALQGETPASPIGMTSLKSIIGHTKAAAGVGALIKAVIAVNQRVVPPMAGVEEPHPIFSDKAQHFYPVIEGEQRSTQEKLRAGVSAMGFGGINSHVTLESYGAPDGALRPSAQVERLLQSHDKRESLVFSARTQAALVRKVQEATATVRLLSRAELGDFAHDCAQRLRSTEPFRAVVLAARPQEAWRGLLKVSEWLHEKLERESSREENEGTTYVAIGHALKTPRIAFLFPGQGAQRVNIGRRLMRRYPWAQAMGERADGIYQSLRGKSLLGEILGRPGFVSEAAATRVNQTEVAQPAISLVNALWFELMQRHGVLPDIVAGHSLGELSALYASQAMDFQTLITLATHRGQLMAHKDGRAGSMIWVAASQLEAQSLMSGVKGYATIANLNAADQTVLSGDPETLQAILERAKDRGIQGGLLPVSNAFHSNYMTGAAEAFAHVLATQTFGNPQVPFVQGTDGQLSEGGDLKGYLSRQITENVNFIQVLNTVRAQVDVIVEVGPGGILSGLARRGDKNPIAAYAVESRPDADSDFKTALAAIYVRGGHVRWQEMYLERFLRPFTPPESRVYIESPTEWPLSIPMAAGTSPALSPHPAASATHPVVAAVPVPVIPVAQAVPPTASTATEPKAVTVGFALPEIESEICKAIAQQTGFDPSTLKPTLRLLDDLNLDSIKVTDLVGNISMMYGVAGDVTASAYANATVRELAQAIKERLDAQGAPPAGLSAAPSPAALDAASQLLSSSVLPPLAVPMNVTSLPSVGRIKSAAKPLQIVGAEPLIAEVSRSKNKQAWVRDFVEVYAAKPLPEPRDWSWKGRKVALVGVDPEAASLRRYQEYLVGQGADVRTILAKTGERFDPDIRDVAMTVVFMPGVKSPGDRDDVTSVALLSGIARGQGPQREATLFLQFDDGCFGTSGSSGRIHSAKAFGQSMAHEATQGKVRVLSVHREWEEQYHWICDRIGDELAADGRLLVAGYGATGVRMVPGLELSKPQDYVPRQGSLGPGDVVLVTGGAKGITAVCALALAKEYRTTMVLVGSSPLTAEEARDPSHPVTATLKNYEDSGLIAHYCSCDISDENAVRAMIADVRERIGSPRAVIHGAGTNFPRPASTVDASQAMRELAPKLLGMKHLLGALREDKLTLIVGLTSVIGVVGMPGNAWYGFANESLDLLLRDYAALHPHVETQTCAYSVWSDVGMGARLGSDKNLESKGIGSINVDVGVKHFMQLVRGRGRDQQIVTTSRLGEIGHAGERRQKSSEYAFDFADHVLHLQPGVEAIAKTKLTLEKHHYLRDHNYKGAFLFPTVFGLEAMAQVVSCLRDLKDQQGLVIQNIKLSRPITVGAQGTDIEIYAEEIESSDHASEVTIRAGIRTASTGYRYDHFAADFVLKTPPEEAVKELPLFSKDLGIKPLEQLYGSILFQGPVFQRIQSIHHLESDNETAGCLVFHSAAAESGAARYLLGDPYVRDTLLQSAQLVIPQNQCLPIEIERIELFGGLASSPADSMCFTDVRKSDEQSYLATVVVFDASRRILQRMTNYRLRFLEKRPQFPRAMDLIPREAPGTPETAPDLLAPYRHIAGQLVIDAESNGPQGQAVFVHRFIPDFKTFSNLSRSIYFSHIFNWMGWAREMSSMPVLDRIRALTETGKWGLVTNWASIDVLGECRNKNRIVEARMWCGKVSGAHNSTAVLTFDWVSKGDQGIEERIAVGRMGFTWVEIYGHGLVRPAPFPDYYKEFIASMIAQNDAEDRFVETAEPYRQLAIGESIYAAKVGPSGGIPLAEKTFETSLFDANLVGNLYFGNYSMWMGKLRDSAFHGMAPDLYKGVGEQGELTCVSSKIQHLREAMPFDEIHVQMSLRAVHRHGLDLVFDFFKKMPDGKGEKLATADHRVIWTRSNERGEKVAGDLPERILEEVMRSVRQNSLGVAG